MSLSPRHIAALQKAGQAVHYASESIAAAVRTQAEGMVANLATRPFAPESEQALAQFRTLAQLGQQLADVELQMQALYATAAELTRPEADVVMALSKQAPSAASGQAEDVIAKPVPARQGKPRQQQFPAKKAGRSPKKPVLRVGNDEKLMQFLRAKLDSKSPTPLTGAALAKGAGLPLGSVAASLRRLLAAGTLKQDAAGYYSLPQ
jgi:hypothetical protein